MISMVMMPSVWVIGNLAGSSSLPPFSHLIWGQCYGNYFGRFSSVFGKKLAFFLKTKVRIQLLHKLPVYWAKMPNFSPNF
jgi:hypothetical protein